jgi:predicted O-methyltransferase YrrM
MARDYVDANLETPRLDRLFPDMAEFDRSVSTWPWLRRDIDHPYRADRRNPIVGFINRDEASILSANARLFSGLAGLEIGAWRGWSTAHLVAAGLRLDVIDPGLGYPDQFRDVAESLARVGGPGSVKLWAGFSPSIVPAVRATQSAPWSFAFIDGYHEGRAPLDDAEAVINLMAPDAIVMLHDLISPHVAAGLGHFADQGWSVGLYNTMQIMGLAWRGAARPVPHVADRNMPQIAAAHLGRYPALSTAG